MFKLIETQFINSIKPIILKSLSLPGQREKLRSLSDRFEKIIGSYFYLIL